MLVKIYKIIKSNFKNIFYVECNHHSKHKIHCIKKLSSDLFSLIRSFFTLFFMCCQLTDTKQQIQ